MKDLYVNSMYKKMYTSHNTKDGREELEIYSCKFLILYVKVKVTQSCLTLCDAMDCTVHGILQARILEWVAIPFSRGSSQPRDWTQVSHIVGSFFTCWATMEAHTICEVVYYLKVEWLIKDVYCRPWRNH